MTLAQEMNLKIVEKRITRDEVYVADEAFFTGTAAEVTPIRELDGRQIGAGSRGPITEKLQKSYFDVVYGRQTRIRRLAQLCLVIMKIIEEQKEVYEIKRESLPSALPYAGNEALELSSASFFTY